MDSFFENPGLSHIGKKILKTLDIKSLSNCRLVCKLWKNEIEAMASKISFQDLEQFLEKYTKARSMSPEEHEIWNNFLVSIYEHSQTRRSKPNLFMKLYLKHFFLNDGLKLRKATTPFFEFVCNGNVRMIRFNLEKENFLGNRIVAELEFQKTLRFAIQSDSLEMVKSLCQVEPTIVSNDRGITPLHDAAKMGCLEIVKFLANLTSNPHIRNIYGKTPIDYARDNGHLEIVAYLNQFPNPKSPKRLKTDH